MTVFFCTELWQTEPLIGRLVVTNGVEAAIEQVFANVLICKDLSIAQEVAYVYAIDCVTFEGDLVRHIFEWIS